MCVRGLEQWQWVNFFVSRVISSLSRWAVCLSLSTHPVHKNRVFALVIKNDISLLLCIFMCNDLRKEIYIFIYKFCENFRQKYHTTHSSEFAQSLLFSTVFVIHSKLVFHILLHSLDDVCHKFAHCLRRNCFLSCANTENNSL
jgi:hypothetical protein